VLEVVRGYRLELAEVPRQEAPPRTIESKRDNLISEEVCKLLTKGAVKAVTPCDNQFLSRIFVVPKKDGTYRPVINLRPLNQFMNSIHFKMEGLNMVKDLLRQDDWMASMDLKDAYLSVTVWEGHRKYLRFMWQDTMFEFQSLPFGLCSAPRVFTKLLKPVLAQLRHQGARVIMYLDDMLLMAQSKDELEEQLEQIQILLEGLGFVINRKKSRLHPTQSIQFLGFLVNSEEMSVKLTEERVAEITTQCRRIQRAGSLSVRQLARLIGKMTATIPAVYPAPLWYRELQRLKNQTLQISQSFEATVMLSQEALSELEWWATSMNLLNGKTIQPQEPSLVIETDASMLGWGAVCSGVRTGGLWSQTEARNHINYLELLAATLAVKAFVKDTRNAHILLKMDNSTAVFYVNRMGGTHSTLLSNLAVHLWQWCLERNVSLSAEHLPGVENCIADEESRTIQSSAEWQLDPTIFQRIIQSLGMCNVDLFATRLNAQMENFVSWRPDPEAIGTDALQLNWTNWRGYAFPPFCLIGKCLRKVREEKASLILIAPVWRSQPWYPMLLELLTDFPRVLPVDPALLTGPFGEPHPLTASGQLQLAAWKLSGVGSWQEEFQKKLPSYWPPDGARAPMIPTRVAGNDGIAGVLKGKWIPFRAL